MSNTIWNLISFREEYKERNTFVYSSNDKWLAILYLILSTFCLTAMIIGKPENYFSYFIRIFIFFFPFALACIELISSFRKKLTINDRHIILNWRYPLFKQTKIDRRSIKGFSYKKDKKGYFYLYVEVEGEERIRFLPVGRISEKKQLHLDKIVNHLEQLRITLL